MLFRPEAFGKQVPVDAYLDKWQSPSGSMSRHYSHVSVQRPSRFQTTRLKIKYSSSYSCSSPQNPGLQLKRKAREDIRHSDILPGFFPPCTHSVRCLSDQTSICCGTLENLLLDNSIYEPFCYSQFSWHRYHPKYPRYHLLI